MCETCLGMGYKFCCVRTACMCLCILGASSIGISTEIHTFRTGLQNTKEPFTLIWGTKLHRMNAYWRWCLSISVHLRNKFELRLPSVMIWRLVSQVVTSVSEDHATSVSRMQFGQLMKFSPFMELEHSLPCSRKSPSGPYPLQDKSSSHSDEQPFRAQF
jgi:hypothetical protein